MSEVAGEGRTVIFVSHNMAAIQALCQRGIFLRHGSVYTDADIETTVGDYLRTLEETSTKDLSQRQERKGKGNIKLTGLSVATGRENGARTLATGHPARFVFEVSESRPDLVCEFTFYDHHGQAIASFSSGRRGPDDIYTSQIRNSIVCEFDEFLLLPGRYRMNVALKHNHELEDHVEAAAFFDVEPGQLRGRAAALDSRYGNVSMPHHWTLPEII
jgi:lipopolysaccharide transport system ATP-binding protein